ncbi:MAG: NUDIX domain-containing protein [Patescibacteria group bacterium]|nr:NUDIX domain-containing protein [Patescibacteria group bacterium]
MKEELVSQLKSYIDLFPEEKDDLEKFLNFTKKSQDFFNRKNFLGHFTVSGLVLSDDHKILLIFHKKLKKYLVPGGHIELNDSSLSEAAIREVREETGLPGVKIHNWHLTNKCPIIIDTHPIPENQEKKEASHWHHDFMFIMQTSSKNINIDNKEINDFKWVDIKIMEERIPNVNKAIKKIIALNIL